MDTISVESYNHSCGILSRTWQRSAGSISKCWQAAGRRGERWEEISADTRTETSGPILDTGSLLTAFPTHITNSNRATPIQGTRTIWKGRKQSGKTWIQNNMISNTDPKLLVGVGLSLNVTRSLDIMLEKKHQLCSRHYSNPKPASESKGQRRNIITASAFSW